MSRGELISQYMVLPGELTPRLRGTVPSRPLSSGAPSPGASQDVRAGPLEAWRSWGIDPETGLLSSVAADGLWPRHLGMTANCGAHDFAGPYRVIRWGSREAPPEPQHRAPHADCTCGIYAARAFAPDPIAASVFGRVRLWGRIIEHARGFRAEHAYPAELLVLSDGAADAPEHYARLRERLLGYGVPVRVLDAETADDLIAAELRAAWRELGRSPVDDLASRARRLLDAGRADDALAVVLSEIRRHDFYEVFIRGSMSPRLPGSSFLHKRENRRFLTEVRGTPPRQRLVMRAVSGQAPLYWGPQDVELDTRTGAMVEAFSDCCGPRHRGHPHRMCGKTTTTIERISAKLRLETWLQLLRWHSTEAWRVPPGVRAEYDGTRPFWRAQKRGETGDE